MTENSFKQAISELSSGENVQENTNILDDISNNSENTSFLQSLISNSKEEKIFRQYAALYLSKLVENVFIDLETLTSITNDAVSLLGIQSDTTSFFYKNLMLLLCNSVNKGFEESGTFCEMISNVFEVIESNKLFVFHLISNIAKSCKRTNQELINFVTEKVDIREISKMLQIDPEALNENEIFYASELLFSFLYMYYNGPVECSLSDPIADLNIYIPNYCIDFKDILAQMVELFIEIFQFVDNQEIISLSLDNILYLFAVSFGTYGDVKTTLISQVRTSLIHALNIKDKFNETVILKLVSVLYKFVTCFSREKLLFLMSDEFTHEIFVFMSESVFNTEFFTNNTDAVEYCLKLWRYVYKNIPIRMIEPDSYLFENISNVVQSFYEFIQSFSSEPEAFIFELIDDEEKEHLFKDLSFIAKNNISVLAEILTNELNETKELYIRGVNAENEECNMKLTLIIKFIDGLFISSQNYSDDSQWIGIIPCFLDFIKETNDLLDKSHDIIIEKSIANLVKNLKLSNIFSNYRHSLEIFSKLSSPEQIITYKDAHMVLFERIVKDISYFSDNAEFIKLINNILDDNEYRRIIAEFPCVRQLVSMRTPEELPMLENINNIDESLRFLTNISKVMIQTKNNEIFEEVKERLKTIGESAYTEGNSTVMNIFLMNAITLDFSRSEKQNEQLDFIVSYSKHIRGIIGNLLDNQDVVHLLFLFSKTLIEHRRAVKEASTSDSINIIEFVLTCLSLSLNHFKSDLDSGVDFNSIADIFDDCISLINEFVDRSIDVFHYLTFYDSPKNTIISIFSDLFNILKKVTFPTILQYETLSSNIIRLFIKFFATPTEIQPSHLYKLLLEMRKSIDVAIDLVVELPTAPIRDKLTKVSDLYREVFITIEDLIEKDNQQETRDVIAVVKSREEDIDAFALKLWEPLIKEGTDYLNIYNICRVSASFSQFISIVEGQIPEDRMEEFNEIISTIEDPKLTPKITWNMHLGKLLTFLKSIPYKIHIV